MRFTARVISGPMPSPGRSVMVCGIPPEVFVKTCGFLGSLSYFQLVQMCRKNPCSAMLARRQDREASIGKQGR